MCLKFCEDYFGVHICIIIFLSSWKKYPFPDRSNRDTLYTHKVHVVKSKFPSYRYAPDCTFSSRKMKKLPSVGAPLPHPPPARSLRSLAKIVPPPNVLAHYAISTWSPKHGSVPRLKNRLQTLNLACCCCCLFDSELSNSISIVTY